MARPIQALREQATALEAALTVCVANPRKKAVHHLRTSTRRIEAQLDLLMQLRDLPSYRTQAATFRRAVKSIRRQAGQVRDLDVLQQMLRGLRLPQHNHRQKLLKALEDRRQKRADDLKQDLEQHIPKIAKAIEELFTALKPAEDLALPLRQLLPLADTWYQRHTRGMKPVREDDLHTIRKVAKVARYIAETGLPAKQATTVAARYNRLQQSGGHWHDALLLTRMARKELGKKDPLTKLTNERAKTHHNSFVRLLHAA